MVSQTSRLSSQIDNGEKIRLSFHCLNKKIIRFLNSLFAKILSNNHMHFLQSSVETILRELIVNAQKANSKRVYFHYYNLDINDQDEYLKGMEQFKSFITEKQDLVEGELKKFGYKVEIFLKKENEGIKIDIKNNNPILQEELNRIQKRIKEAHQYGSFAEVYSNVSDDIEGEGLGILLIILFLRNSGIGEQSFKISSNKQSTMTHLTIPFELKPVCTETDIERQIINEIKELPTFPENIIELQTLCRYTDVTIRQLADKVILDPSLSTTVLKLSNSAGFITSKRIEGIEEAIKLIGIKNLESILIASSSMKILEERYPKFREIWNHCNKVAFYSRMTALHFGYAKISDKVFLAGLLHDLGKIVLLSTSPELSEKISSLASNREIRTSTIIEEVSIGISHATIGKLIAEKWKLPQYLIETINYHHTPLESPEEHKNIIFIVYLANKLCNIESKKFFFEYCEENVLNHFSLNDENKFNIYHEKLRKLYEEHCSLLLKE